MSDPINKLAEAQKKRPINTRFKSPTSKVNPIKENMYAIAAFMLRKEFKTVYEEYNFMDSFAYEHGGDSVEIEIKVNDYDFCKEFTKPCKKAKHLAYRYHAKKPHGFCPTRFYFFVPIKMKDRALARIIKTYPEYGLIVWDAYNMQETIIRKAKRMHEKPFIGEWLDKPFLKYLKHYKDQYGLLS